MIVGLVDYIREKSDRVPVLLGYGPDVSIGSVSYDTSRVTLGVHYAIVNNGAENAETESLRRQVEFGLSSTQSWDIQINVKTQSGKETPSTFWTSFVGQVPTVDPNTRAPKRLILRFAHSPLEPGEELVRVNVSIEQTTGSTAGVRINGIPITIERMRPTDETGQGQAPKRPLLEDTASMTGVSLRTISTIVDKQEGRKDEREGVVQKGISSLVKRNYICE